MKPIPDLDAIDKRHQAAGKDYRKDPVAGNEALLELLLTDIPALTAHARELRESLRWALQYRVPAGREPSTDNPLHRRAH